MTDADVADQGIEHFGAVTASLSHELSNAFATVREASGLIGDYLDGLGSGVPMEESRFQQALDRINRSTDRGLEYVQVLHWVAHSVDQSEELLDLQDVVKIAAFSARYFAMPRRVEFDVTLMPGSTPIGGSAFELHQLLFSCFLATAQSAAERSTVHVHVNVRAEEYEVAFAVDALAEATPLSIAVKDRLFALAVPWEGKIETYTATSPECCIVLRLPKSEYGNGMGSNRDPS